MKRISPLFAALALAAFPASLSATPCSDALSTLKAQLSAPPPVDLQAAIDTVRAAGCNQATQRAALTQASGAMARQAQKLVADGALEQAQSVLDQAPALHWAIQAVRGDIAAQNGNRTEAAQMYAAALDTITDPNLTPPDPRLVQVAERISKLAQENMMLAGTMASAVTRGGQASGVLRAAVRGIRIEKAGTKVAEPAQSTNTSTYAAPKADLYANAPKETYVVADAVAESIKSVFLPIRFAFGSDQIDSAGVHEAQTLAQFLLANQVDRLTVVGHTDEIGSEATNLDLSIRRARTVKHFLQSKGVHAHIDVIGKGESHPPQLVDYAIYSDEERRKIARRVELILHE
jgi:outer membrane protein OmpA-like peptidoglycan-associated protein